MPARARIVVGVAAAAVAVLAGGTAWQLLAERNTLWAGFFGSAAAPLAFVGSDTCAQCHTAEAKLWRASQHERRDDASEP